MEKAFESALAGFSRHLPVVHLNLDEGAALRQALIVPARPDPSAPCDRPVFLAEERALVILETSSRTVRFFTTSGASGQLDREMLEALCGTADRCAEMDGFTECREMPLPHRWEWEPIIGYALAAAFARAHPEFAHEADEAAEPLLRRAQWELCAFFGSVDRATLDACVSFGLDTLRGFNALAHADPRIALYRRQAVAALPILALLWNRSDSAVPERVTQAVDRREPLFRAVAEAWEVPKETIRFLGGKTPEHLGLDDGGEGWRTWLHDPGWMLRALSAIAPEHRPRTRVEWGAFYEMVGAFRRCEGLPVRLTHAFLREAGRQGLCAARDAFIRRHAGLSALSASREFLHALTMELKYRAACADPAHTAALLAEAVGLDRLLRCSKRWLDLTAQKTTARLTVNQDGQEPFPPPFPVPAMMRGFRLVFLDGFGALVEEGLRMSHCIPMLYPECARGRRLAFSLRNADGSPCATFDLSLVRGRRGAHAVLNELRGPGNESAPEECRKAVEELVAEVDAGLQGNPQLADQWPESAPGTPAAIPNELVEEAAERAKREALCEVLAEIGGFGRLLKGPVPFDSHGPTHGGSPA